VTPEKPVVTESRPTSPAISRRAHKVIAFMKKLHRRLYGTTAVRVGSDGLSLDPGPMMHQKKPRADPEKCQRF